MDRLKKCDTNISSGNRPGKYMLWPAFRISAAVLLILAALLFLPASKQLIITDEETGDILYAARVRAGDCFSLKYIHSVNKSPVEDVFEIADDNSIVLRKTVFLSFGAGVPTEAEDGQVFDLKDDRVEISNIDRPVSNFLLKVGTVADHTLCIGERQIRLDSLADPMRTVRLEVRNVPIILTLRGIGNE